MLKWWIMKATGANQGCWQIVWVGSLRGIGRVFQFLWCKYSIHGQFQITEGMSLNVELVRGVCSWLLWADTSWLQHSPVWWAMAGFAQHPNVLVVLLWISFYTFSPESVSSPLKIQLQMSNSIKIWLQSIYECVCVCAGGHTEKASSF